MQNNRYTTWQSAYRRGREAEGKTLPQLFTDKKSLHVDKSVKKGKKYNKSRMGDAFESWLYKPKDNDSEPDLMPAHVELKATPFRIVHNKNKYSAKERLVFNKINYKKLVHETFNYSHFLCKNKRILLGFYLYNKNPRKCKMHKVILYQILKSSPYDLGIIKHDWNIIKNQVEAGKADKLNERMTDYLEACPKAENSKSRTEQPYSTHYAMPRAFALKTGYMSTLLRKYILNPHPKNVPRSIFHGSLKSLKSSNKPISYNVNDSIFNKNTIKNQSIIKNKSIDLKAFVLKIINRYRGWTNVKLAHKFNITLTPKTSSKNFNYQIISAMFGLDKKHCGNAKGVSNADEFQKANIVPKTIQFNVNGKNIQSMSLPAFSFKDFNHETWHNSILFHELYDTKFLFCAFKCLKDNNKPYYSIFLGATFYQFPIKYLDGVIQKVWTDTKYKVIKGNVTLRGTYNKNGKHVIRNNFLGMGYSKKNHMIIHVRTHSGETNYAYNGKNTDYLPWGVNWINRPKNHIKYSDNYMTNQSFWINNTFIRQICKGLLK